jgi:hypothetical protein
MHQPGQYDTLATLQLTGEQIRDIEGKTGVKVSEIEVLSVILTGEAARTRSPEAEAGLIAVACW